MMHSMNMRPNGTPDMWHTKPSGDAVCIGLECACKQGVSVRGAGARGAARGCGRRSFVTCDMGPKGQRMGARGHTHVCLVLSLCLRLCVAVVLHASTLPHALHDALHGLAAV